jgi:HAMP domain-containing protein
MSFRRRMVLLAATAVAAAIVLASGVVYVVTRGELRGQLDASLREKIQPGRRSAVRIEISGTRGQLAKLAKEGKLQLPPSAMVGVTSGIDAPAVRARGVTTISPLEARRLTAPTSESATPTGPIGAEPPAAHGGSASHVSGTKHSGSAAHSGAARSKTTHTGSGGGSSQEIVTIERKAVSSGGGVVYAKQSLGHTGQTSLMLPSTELGGSTGYAQLVLANGEVIHTPSKGYALPITAATRAVAAGHEGAFFSDAKIKGTPVRMLTQRGPQGAAWQVALPLTDVDNTLTHLKLVLALVSLCGVALAAALGLLVSRAALVPVRRLTGAAERVARTQDLGHRIDAGQDDELGRLSASFNTMLAALERARLAQRQLISDASHELRTPLTSVQANLDALALGDRLRPAERSQILAAAQAQLHELTVLVGDLVDLSKTEIDETASSCWTRRPAWCARRPHGWIARSRTCSTTPPSGTHRAYRRHR